jgi:hypothetical protein
MSLMDAARAGPVRPGRSPVMALRLRALGTTRRRASGSTGNAEVITLVRRTSGLPQGRRPKSCAAANGSGTSSRRSRNTMRVKPYAIRSPSRNARHTALPAPGGSRSTSGCSCRYRSSLRTWSGGPGGTSCTGQYRYPVSCPRNRLVKNTRHPPSPPRLWIPSARMDMPAAIANPGITTTCAAAARQYPRGGLRAADTTGLLIRLRPSADQVVRADRTYASPPSCRIEGVAYARIYAQPCIIFHH